jgi:ABC-type sugar transport system ATPase subunit
MAFLEFNGITKGFPGVRALSAVSFSVEAGSCHALMGENGAGKSTLGKILAGVYTADAGEIFLEGRSIRPSTPLEARECGIAMVHQELAFCPNLSVAENLCLGSLPTRAGWVDRRRLHDRADAMLREIGASFDLDQPVGSLSTGQEQLIQIAAAVGSGARILVMDEPTSSLAAAECEHLFLLIGQLRARGITLLYVSHRMEEIFRLCNAITVLRDGRHVATQAAANLRPDQLIHQMIGRQVEASSREPRRIPTGEVVLEVEGLASSGRFGPVSFAVRRGEIVGFAGLIGAGRSEVAQALFGLDPLATGHVLIDGKPLSLRSTQAALASGIGLVPEDRKRQGLVLSLNCRENTSLAVLPRLTRLGFLDLRRERSLASEYAARLRVRTPDIDAPIAGLSGGNQQKIALAKWLARECNILIVDEPTRGVDVGAKAEIHRLLEELAAQGLTLILISSELPEVMGLSDRILVMRGGRIAADVPRCDFTQAGLMRWMAGVEPAEGPASEVGSGSMRPA